MAVLDWLLDSDPAIRRQVLRDLTDAPEDVVAAERSRVATEGWGARLLAQRGPDGQWAGGACFPGDFQPVEGAGQPWTSTLPSLVLLRDLGLDPHSAAARETVELVRENCRWEYDGAPFFDGEVDDCINGLERLLAHERATGGTRETAQARRRGEEYLLERLLFRRKSTGETVLPTYQQLSYPPQWHYDVLRALDHFRDVGDAPDPRVDEAAALVRDKQQPDGTWLLENTHKGAMHFLLEDGDGRPSRWNTCGRCAYSAGTRAPTMCADAEFLGQNLPISAHRRAGNDAGAASTGRSVIHLPAMHSTGTIIIS